MGTNTAPKNFAVEGKPRPTLLPLDVLMKYLTPAYEEGVKKYVRESWRGGFELSVLGDALLRHFIAFFYQGEDWDPDAAQLGIKKHHLGGALFCLLSMLWTLETRPELDDRAPKMFQAWKKSMDKEFDRDIGIPMPVGNHDLWEEMGLPACFRSRPDTREMVENDCDNCEWEKSCFMVKSGDER